VRELPHGLEVARVRIGVFGGTFDPPHIGHLLVAGDAADRLQLDRLLWVPATQQPLKAGTPPAASGSQRADMVGLTIAGDPRFALEPMELARAGLSFTVDTIEQLAGREAGSDLYLLLGEDALALFERWREPERIRSLVTIVGLRRDGAEGPVVERGIEWITTRRIDVSSTEIRARIARRQSIRGFVVDDVAAYIAAAGLYR
jgi:nicotinate-nucleotide adenylyltransferase